jgi:hypothetical protein
MTESRKNRVQRLAHSKVRAALLMIRSTLAMGGQTNLKPHQSLPSHTDSATAS